MSLIKTLKNKEGSIIYPQTHGTAVFVNEGEILQDKINQYLTAEDIDEFDEITTEVEFQNNKVTEINENSTNATYPSAKAVYDFGMSIKNIGIKVEIVNNGLDEVTNPNLTTIYLVSKENAEEKNLYDEYLYIENKWEKIGSTEIDLSGYATIEYVDSQIGDINTILSTLTNV